MFLGLVAALVAAALFGVVAVVQAAVIRHQGLFTPRMLLVLGIYLVGWLLHLVAIAQLPLYLAQVAVGASLVVAALVAAFVMGEPLLLHHWAAIAAMAVGLGLLALASGSVGDSDFTSTTAVMLYVLLVANALLGWMAWRWGSEWSGVALGVLAGTAYAGSPVASRALVDFHLDASTIASALTIGLYGGLGFLLYSAAMKRTSVTAATSPVVLLQTVIPAIVGVVTFGDGVRDGWWLPAVFAFAISVAAAVVLCGAEARIELLEEAVDGADQPS